MSDSTFDPEAFMNTTTEGEMSTKIIPVPAADYHATIDTIKGRQFTSDKGTFRVMDVFYDLLETAEAQPLDDLMNQLGRQKLTVKQTVFLDFNEQGALDTSEGKNVTLGRLREACGQNTGSVWSPQMLVGAGPIVIRVTERPDEKNPENVYNDVSRVAAITAAIAA